MGGAGWFAAFPRRLDAVAEGVWSLGAKTNIQCYSKPHGRIQKKQKKSKHIGDEGQKRAAEDK